MNEDCPQCNADVIVVNLIINGSTISMIFANFKFIESIQINVLNALNA